MADGWRLLPKRMLLRGGAEESVRRDLVDEDLVEAVIQLPTDMFFGAAIPACWLILNRTKAETRRGQLSSSMLRSSLSGSTRRTFCAMNTSIVSSTPSNRATHFRGFRLGLRRARSPSVITHSPSGGTSGGQAADGDALSVTDALSAYREARGRREQAESRLLNMLNSLED